MVKNRFHSSIKKNIKFLEDAEIDFSYSNLKQNYSPSPETEETKNESEESSNFMNFAPEYYESSSVLGGSGHSSIYNDEESQKILKKRDFEILKEENTINLNFLQAEESIFPTWQLEDYFIL